MAQAPPAPPPLQPGNPYDFITNPGTPQKKPLIGGGDSTQMRILIAVVIGLFLIVIIAVVMSFLNSAGKEDRAKWQTLAVQQHELIRISDIGVKDAAQSATKNFAINTKLSLSSRTASLLGFAKKAGATVTPKQLALSEDEKLDSQLNTAKQANQFDTTFTQLIRAKLQDYQKTVQAVYNQSKAEKTRAVLSEEFENIQTLLGPVEATTQ